MVYLNSDYIITPLGEGIDANLNAIKEGRTMLQLHSCVHGEELVSPVMASLLEDHIWMLEGYSWFESLCIRAIQRAIDNHPVDISNSRCIFVLSSTKGDIWCSMADTASHIAQHFGNSVSPVVVSTACTSGVSAQIFAYRLIETKQYDTVVVVGCDIQREFVVSGFQCFHALSDTTCMPFDAHRNGLNAGEAVACMILSDTNSGLGWQLLGGSIHNDANHISGPSRTAEGSLRCMQDVLQKIERDDLACISVHGTGTIYNDEMESIALHRSGVQDVPVTALKGFYGHTMGAAGLMETIISLHALSAGEILPTKGYTEQGTSCLVNVDSHLRTTQKTNLIKLLSGFGGVNSAVAWTLTGHSEKSNLLNRPIWRTIASVQLDSNTDLVALYKDMALNYPKFYKMDLLCRLGFISVELLLAKIKEQQPDFELSEENSAVVLANHSASLKNDTDYQSTIQDKSNYFPSPSLFVYTLPNIVTGELAIRHNIKGETSCFILTRPEELENIKRVILNTTTANQIIIGWVECSCETEYTADIELIIRE